MPEPTYWTAAGFKTLEEMKASVDQCAEIGRHPKAVGEAASEVLNAADKLEQEG